MKTTRFLWNKKIKTVLLMGLSVVSFVLMPAAAYSEVSAQGLDGLQSKQEFPFGADEARESVDSDSFYAMKEEALIALNRLVSERDRLRLWTVYFEAKMRRCEKNRKGQHVVEERLDKLFPFVVGSVPKKAERALAYLNRLSREKEIMDKNYWYVEKSKAYLVAFCSALSLIAGYVGEKLVRDRPVQGAVVPVGGTQVPFRRNPRNTKRSGGGGFPARRTVRRRSLSLSDLDSGGRRVPVNSKVTASVGTDGQGGDPAMNNYLLGVLYDLDAKTTRALLSEESEGEWETESEGETEREGL